LIWESGGCKTGVFRRNLKIKKKKQRISTGNRFEEEDFYPDKL
jgi:hypothetical protein